ncbi:hypothetical protein [Polynucleobacter sp. es-MAR-4]|uniref:hypothetical protein n=1 Tax=Polynucleobacter sp. es-MAR-4 TaxID=1855655 RepID=UPI001C0CE58E|nr:hypothetical protein [Polynucleobacter sp. es-MAR-4]MBU3637370.1 hypothetical protein [Polynucleobacter sp. es-MAR-4]
MTPSNPSIVQALNRPTQHEMQWAEAIVAQHGVEPSSLTNSSEHEAGHIVCAAAMGFHFKAGYLARDKHGMWGGYSEVMPSGIFGDEINSLEEPIRAFFIGIHTISGWAGEMFKHSAHPASSLDERIVVNRICAGIAKAQGVDAEVVMGAMLGAATYLIATNAVLFDTTACTLKLNKRLMRSEFERYCSRNLKQVSMVSLLPEWLHKEEAV